MDKKEKVRQFSLTKEETEAIETLKRIFGDLKLQMRGISKEMDYKLLETQVRLNIHEEKIPEGYHRDISLDEASKTLIIKDIPITPEIARP